MKGCQGINERANCFRDGNGSGYKDLFLRLKNKTQGSAPAVRDLKRNLFRKAWKADPKNQVIIFLQSNSPSDLSLERYWK